MSTVQTMDGRPQLRLSSRHLWLALCFVYICISVASNALFIGYFYFDPAGIGSLGAHFAPAEGSGLQRVAVANLRPQSPLAGLGIRNGDRVRFDRPWDDLRAPYAGERVGFTRLSPGSPTHLSVVAVASPISPADYLESVLFRTDGLLMLAVGLFMLWHRRGVVATMVLALVFVCYSAVVPLFSWPVPSGAFPFWAAFIFAGETAAPLLFLRFAMLYARGSNVKEAARDDRLFYVLAILQTIAFAVEAYGTLQNVELPYLSGIKPFSYGLQISGIVLSTLYLALGWLKSQPAARKRYVLMLVALPLSFCPNIIYLLEALFTNFNTNAHSPFIIAAGIGQFVGPLLFAYAVLRHKILDLGFAINRVLVYGAVSAILLVTFGILEGLSEHFIPVVGREKSALIDACIALVIFLTFHRVRDFAEHHTEAVFFRGWQRNEAALKRFVREADFIGKNETLSKAFVAELSRFGGGADCALYMLKSGCGYRLAEGALAEGPEAIDADDPALVSLRANRAPIEIDETGSSLPAALALPMVHRDDLLGLILLGAKPSREAYRPDEIEVLGWAAHQIGLDLHALRVEQLERANAMLEMKYNELKAVLSSPLGLAQGKI